MTSSTDRQEHWMLYKVVARCEHIIRSKVRVKFLRFAVMAVSPEDAERRVKQHLYSSKIPRGYEYAENISVVGKNAHKIIRVSSFS